MKLLDWLLGRREKRPRRISSRAVNWAKLHFPPDQQSIAAHVADIICEQLGVTLKQLSPTTQFIEDLGADGLDSVELVMAFEEDFEIKFPDADCEKLCCIGDLVDYLNQRLAHSDSPAPAAN